MSYKTRKRGTKNQIGKRFPVNKNSKGKSSYKKPSMKMQKIRREKMNNEGSSRMSWERYLVRFHYKDGRSEELIMGARDSDDALSQALKVRKIKRKPVRVEVVDSVASVASAIANGVTQFVGGVAVGVGSGVAESARLAERNARETGVRRKSDLVSVREKSIRASAKEIASLIRLTESKDKHVRRMALKDLKRKYPDAHGRLALKSV